MSLRRKKFKDLIASIGKCENCGEQDDLTIDHIIPKSLGGDNGRKNLQVLCKTCNGNKGNKCNERTKVRLFKRNGTVQEIIMAKNEIIRIRSLPQPKHREVKTTT